MSSINKLVFRLGVAQSFLSSTHHIKSAFNFNLTSRRDGWCTSAGRASSETSVCDLLLPRRPKPMNQHRVSIEILPGGLDEWSSISLPPGSEQPNTKFPFVFAEGNLGIPKKVLYPLYIAAISMPKTPSHLLRASTSVIILANPAHQTALNNRKRLVESGLLLPEEELVFIELLVRGSRVCAKQSMIWDHRRWIFRFCYKEMSSLVHESLPYLPRWSTFEEARSLPRLPPDFIRKELDIIKAACQSYPRNYHAWTHWHHVIDVAFISAISSSDSIRLTYFAVIYEENIRLRSWISNHVSEFTAAHHLCSMGHVIDHLASLDENIVAEAGGSCILVDDAYSLASNYPTHPCLWMYLRVALGYLHHTPTVIRLLQDVKLNFGAKNQYASELIDWYAMQGVRLSP